MKGITSKKTTTLAVPAISAFISWSASAADSSAQTPTSGVTKVAQVLAQQANYTNSAAGYKWGAGNKDSKLHVSQSWDRRDSGFKWQGDNAKQETQARGAKSVATSNAWGVRNAATQAGMKWGIRNTADQSGMKWGIR